MIFTKRGCYQGNPQDPLNLPWLTDISNNKTGLASFGETLLRTVTSTCAEKANKLGNEAFILEGTQLTTNGKFLFVKTRNLKIYEELLWMKPLLFLSLLQVLWY